jgi:hypothetical protein
MARAKEKPLYSNPTDYEDDFYAWTYQQAQLLRLGRSREADLSNIIEELETLGRSERKALRSSYRLVLAHLLKWQFQPSHRTRLWSDTMQRERRNIREDEDDSSKLKAMADEIMVEAYRLAREQAADETELDVDTFPVTCPWTLDQIRDLDYFPQ